LAALVLLCLPGTSIAAAGLLQYGAGYGKAEGAPQVRDVQRTLHRLGWQPGPVDGLYGPRTEAAVTQFQAATHVGVDGIVGPQTRGALKRVRTEPLRRGAGFAQPDGSPRVRVLQSSLQRHGFRPGPVDGLFGPLTQAAVERAQKARGVPVNGVATAKTRRAIAGAPKQPDQLASSEEPSGGAPAGEEPSGESRGEAPQQPSGEAPSAQQPSGEAPTTQEPSGEAPTAQQPSGEAPNTQEPSGEAPTAQQPSGEATPAGTVQRSESDGVSVPIAVLIGGLALALGLIGGTFLGRRNRVVSGTAVPLAQGVVAEGTTNAGRVGRFRGPVHALVLGRRGLRRTPEARYLVSDPGIKDPFWVSQDEVTNIVPPARSSPFRQTEPSKVLALGYVSVPANKELQSSDFDAQLEAIDRYCDQQGWELVEVVRDVDAGARDLERQGLLYALDKIGRGEAECIIVAELGRLSRSAADLGGVLDRLKRTGGRLVALDLGLDTASPEGRVAAQALASVSAWEHERSRKGLAAAAAGSTATAEPQVVQDVPALKRRIAAMREEGMTLQAIADVLNAEGVPTLRGGSQWRPSSVQSAAGYRRPPKRQNE
jgi:peptidoglycan hydrolase-like protein with peptidoglycan-binding domain/DNA invertase Pin-like site-specific DNA recombinase